MEQGTRQGHSRHSNHNDTMNTSRTTVDIRPTWKSAVEVYIHIMEHGAEADKQLARSEFRRMAVALDQTSKTKEV